MLISALAAVVMFASPEATKSGDIAAAKPAAEAKSPKKTCYSATPSGSRLPRKVCVTEAPAASDAPAKDVKAEPTKPE